MATEIRPIDEVRSTLTKMENELKSVLPSYISPAKFQQVVVTALQLNPSLLSLDRQSLYSACLNCASDGLIPNGKEAALVPFKGKVSYMPMVGGILKLIRNSGELATVDACTVHEKDFYESYVDQTGPKFKHVKARGERGVPILTFAYALTKDGAVYHEEITEEELNTIKSKANDKFSAWQGEFADEMKRKTVLKRLSKRLPKSTDLERVIERDNEIYDLEVPEKQPETTSSKLADAVTPKQEVEEAQVVPPEPKKPEHSTTSELQNGNKEVRGLIEKLDKKQSEPGATKQWMKFGCKIAEKWYSTFDKTLWKDVEFFADKRVLVILEYVEKPYKTKDGGSAISNEIISIKPQTLEDVNDDIQFSDNQSPI